LKKISNNEPCIESDVVLSKTVSPASFFTNKETSLTCKKPPTKKRKYLSTIVSGKAITEDDMFEAIKEHEAARKPSSTGKGKKTSEKGKKQNKSNKSDPVPSTSVIRKQTEVFTNVDNDDDGDDNSIDESEKCCVCNKFTPDEVRNSVSLVFTKWVQCDKCGHWTHLKYCTNIAVVRRGDHFFCKHCTPEE
jgi:hypothetical protein